MRAVYLDNETLDKVERTIKPLLDHKHNANWFLLDNELAKARSFAIENNDQEAHEIADKIQKDVDAICKQHEITIEFLSLVIAQAKVANELHTNFMKGRS